MSPGTGTSWLESRPQFSHTRSSFRFGVALALGVVLAFGAQSSAQQPPLSIPLDGSQLAELSLSEGTLLDLDLPDRLIAPFDLDLVFGGEVHTLVLEPHSVRAPGYRVLVQGAGGLLAAADAPAPRTLRGRILGSPESRAGGSLMDGGLRLLVRLEVDGPLWVIQPLRDGRHALYTQSAVVGSGKVCGTYAPHLADQGPQELSGVQPGDELQEAEIALDADFEYFQLLSNSVDSVVTDLENIIEQTRLIYAGEVGISYLITSITVRSQANDPYTSSDAGTLLGEFRSIWNQAFSGTPRDVAHLFTGRNLNGSVIGVAFLDVLCNKPLAYGLSQSRFSGNLVQRVGLTAHELGHNWASPHCDGTPDCAIMCSGLGGCTGNLQVFGSTATAAITQKKQNSSCLTTVVEPGLPTLNTVFPTFGSEQGGGVLELHGADLPTAAMPVVTIGETVVVVLSASETLVTVAIPAGPPATTVDVTLTDGTTLTVLPKAYRFELDIGMGDKVTSKLGQTEVERFYFLGLAGSRITARLKPLNALEGLIAGLRVVGPSGAVLTTVGGGFADQGKPVSLKKFQLAATGVYRIEAFAIGVSSGTYQLKTKSQPAKSVKATLAVTSTIPDPEIMFSAEAGSLLKLAHFKRLSPKGQFALVDGEPADLIPTLLGLVGPAGSLVFGDLLTLSAKGKWARVKQLVLPVAGDYTLRFGGLENSIGHGKARVKVKPPKKSSESFVLAP